MTASILRIATSDEMKANSFYALRPFSSSFQLSLSIISIILAYKEDGINSHAARTLFSCGCCCYFFRQQVVYVAMATSIWFLRSENESVKSISEW